MALVALCLAFSLSLPLLAVTNTVDPCLMTDALGNVIDICPDAGQETVSVVINGTNYTGTNPLQPLLFLVDFPGSSACLMWFPACDII